MLKSIVFLGASGAVGSAVLENVLKFSELNKVLLLNRRKLDLEEQPNLQQQIVDIEDAKSYENSIKDFAAAICTLGVGQPSKVSDEVFLKIDKTAVLDFAKACKANGVKHFQLLSSIGADSSSRSFYLKSKGELIDELEALKFDRLSIFQPSMILTPTNRYGLTQAIILKVWPKLHFILQGKATKYRGIKLAELGKAIAKNFLSNKEGTEILQYDQFKTLVQEQS